MGHDLSACGASEEGRGSVRPWDSSSQRWEWFLQSMDAHLRLGERKRRISPLSLFRRENELRVGGALQDHRLFRARGFLAQLANLG